jgi:hypothetical protein
MAINKTVQKYMDKLGISEDEAKALVLFDSGKADVPAEVLTIEEKLAKKASSPINKVKNLKAVPKVDKLKKRIIDIIWEMVLNKEQMVKPQMVKTGKVVFQDSAGGWYTLTLTKNKEKPDGYNSTFIDPEYEE